MGKERVIEGLNQDAQLRLKFVLDGLDNFRRGVAQVQDDLGSDMPKAIGETEQALIDLDKAWRKATEASKRGFRDQEAAAKDVADAWERAVKKVQEQQAKFALNRRAAAVGQNAGVPLSELSEPQKDQILAVDSASKADIVKGIKQERKERADAAREAAQLEAELTRAAEREDQRRADSRARLQDCEQKRRIADARDEAAEISRSIQQQEKEREKLAAEVVAAEQRMEAATKKRVAAAHSRDRQTVRSDNRSAEIEWTRKLKEAEADLDAQRGKSTGNLITERYALYDVASTAGAAAAGLGLLVGSYEAVAISRERAFADVTRVTGFQRDSEQAAALRDQLVDLTKEIPQSFEDISKVTQLLAQQNVDTPFLESATEAVIKFATTTGISTDTVAEDLGKLSNILGLGAAGFDILGKSIAYAGAKSAATEPQIIAVAKEIAPYARDAGFAADETIGLATALASLAVPPERARSAIAALFTTIDRSISSGGERLENFARVSGMTVDEFVQGWSNDPQRVFQSFIEGTSHIGDLTGALDVLGIDGRLAGTVIRALQSDTDLLAESFQNANDGIENGFLDKSFEQIVSTVAAKITLLVNAVQNLADSVGGPTLAGLAQLISFLADGANNLSSFIDRMGAAGRVIGTVGTIVLVLVAGLLVLTAVLAGTRAAAFAVTTAITLMDGKLTASQARVANFTLGLIGMGNAAVTAARDTATLAPAGEAAGAGLTAAARGAKIMRAALVSTGVGALLVLLGSVVGGFMEANDAQEDLAASSEETAAAFEDEGDQVVELASKLREAVLAANEFVSAQGDMEGSLYELGQSMQKNGTDFTAFSVSGRANMKALESVISSTVAQAGGDAQLLANMLLGIQQQLVATGASGEAIEMVQRAIDATEVSATRAVITSNSLAVGLETVADKAKEARNALGQLISEVRTVTDYSRELSGVLDRSFDIQFGPQAAYDRILSIYNRMRKEAADAAKEVRNLQDKIRDTESTIGSLQSDRVGAEYSLSIASQYGDTIRAAQIASQIAEIDSKIATGKSDLVDLNGELVTAEQARSQTLEGNTEAAIRNRDTMRELIAAQADYIAALAASGAPQSEIQAAQQALATQFQTTTAELGFSAQQINGPYVGALNNMAAVIAGVPRNVNIEITGLSAAEAALYESLARMEAASDESGKRMATDFGENVADAAAEFNQIPDAAEGLKDELGDLGAEAGKSWFDSLWEWLRKGLEKIIEWGGNAGQFLAGLFSGQGADGFSPGGDWLGINGGHAGFAEGGFTGQGGKYDVAGFVHRGEFVNTQEDVRFWGVETFARMHRIAQSGGFSGGGSTGGNVGSFFGAGSGGGGPLSLSQDTIERIAEANGSRPVILVADGRAVAQLVSSGNAAVSRGI
jgi:TP901 family phage tail tape measure protein